MNKVCVKDTRIILILIKIILLTLIIYDSHRGCAFHMLNRILNLLRRGKDIGASHAGLGRSH